MSVELLPYCATFDKSLDLLVLQSRQLQQRVRSKIPVISHIRPLCLDLRQTAAPTSLYLKSTLELSHKAGLRTFKVMCDKQALCNELRLSCKSKLDRHAHAFALTQSPTVPLPHEQLQGNIYKAKWRFSCGMDECTCNDFLPGSTQTGQQSPRQQRLTSLDPRGLTFLFLLSAEAYATEYS